MTTNIDKAGRLVAAATEEDELVTQGAEKMLTTPPENCAADIIKGLRRGHNRILTGNNSSTMFWLARLFPNSYPKLLKLLG